MTRLRRWVALAELPKVIEKLEGLMADHALFKADPDKFQKASDALVARHEMRSDAEAEWMELEALRAYRFYPIF